MADSGCGYAVGNRCVSPDLEWSTERSWSLGRTGSNVRENVEALLDLSGRPRWADLD